MSLEIIIVEYRMREKLFESIVNKDEFQLCIIEFQ